MQPWEEAQTRLFDPPTEAFIAQVSWRLGEGWRVWVSSWGAGQEPSEGYSAVYEHLTADEALDALLAEQATRCEWLRR